MFKPRTNQLGNVNVNYCKLKFSSETVANTKSKNKAQKLDSNQRLICSEAQNQRKMLHTTNKALKILQTKHLTKFLYIISVKLSKEKMLSLSKLLFICCLLQIRRCKFFKFWVISN